MYYLEYYNEGHFILSHSVTLKYLSCIEKGRSKVSFQNNEMVPWYLTKGTN